MIKLDKILVTDKGRRIDYSYSISENSSKFFNAEDSLYVKYRVDISNVPKSILAIPFLANILPISWFGNFDIIIDELDEDFYNAIQILKSEFQKQFSSYNLGGNILVTKKVKNDIDGSKYAMLFSGGVDAYATYIRNYTKIPDLITIHGADIEIKDTKQWNDFTNFLRAEKLLKSNHKEYIETNVRTFYTYHVELLLEDIGWWGKVQHGLSLVGSLAPLSYVQKYKSIFIASSYTDHIEIAWGSTPQIDESITWAGIKVFHDGYELKRQDKVDLITGFSKEKGVNLKLRVCYSELRNEFNCSNCEKCFRTILGIILNGQDPNNYGFKVDKNIYENIFRSLSFGNASKGQKYFWWELMEKAKTTNKPFIFNNIEKETEELDRIRNGELDRMLQNKLENPRKGIYRIKFIFRNKFPRAVKFLKKLKRGN